MLYGGPSFVTPITFCYICIYIVDEAMDHEIQIAIQYANVILDAAYRFETIDPDGEEAILARQFIRLCKKDGIIDDSVIRNRRAERNK